MVSVGKLDLDIWPNFAIPSLELSALLKGDWMVKEGGWVLAARCGASALLGLFNPGSLVTG